MHIFQHGHLETTVGRIVRSPSAPRNTRSKREEVKRVRQSLADIHGASAIIKSLFVLFKFAPAPLAQPTATRRKRLMGTQRVDRSWQRLKMFAVGQKKGQGSRAQRWIDDFQIKTSAAELSSEQGATECQ